MSSIIRSAILVLFLIIFVSANALRSEVKITTPCNQTCVKKFDCSICNKNVKCKGECKNAITDCLSQCKKK